MTDPQTRKEMQSCGPTTHLAHYSQPWGIYEKDDILKISNTTLTAPQTFEISAVNDLLDEITASKYSPAFLSEKATIILTLYMKYPRANQIATGPKYYLCIFISSIFLLAHNIIYIIGALSGLGIFYMYCTNLEDFVTMVLWAGQTLPSTICMIIFMCVKCRVKYPYGKPVGVREYEDALDMVE